MADESIRQAEQAKEKNILKKHEKQSAEKAPIKKISEKKDEKKGIIEKAKEKIQEIKGQDKAKKEEKIILEREYIVPLRREWLKVPKYKRANKAVKALKEFMARHMKEYDRDLRKVKIDAVLNNELRFRGIKKPPAKIKVKAVKNSDGIIRVYLIDIPKHIEFELARKAKKEAEELKKISEKKGGEKPREEKKEELQSQEEKKEEKEKEISSKEAEQQFEKMKAKQMKHTAGLKKAPVFQRKALRK